MNAFKPFQPKADPSQPNNLGLIRSLADFGGQIVQAVQNVRFEGRKALARDKSAFAVRFEVDHADFGVEPLNGDSKGGEHPLWSRPGLIPGREVASFIGRIISTLPAETRNR
jgi:hypothetical protein